MQFSYHQLIVLTSYANAHIAGLNPPPFAKTMVMKHIGGMAFKGAAKTAEEWFASLKGASGARLLNRNGDWKIEIHFANEPSHYWTEHGSADGVVIYTRKKGSTRGPQANVPEVTSRLMFVLDDIHAFSKQHDCGNFTRIFAEAKSCLAPNAKLPKDWMTEFSPANVLTPESARLLAAAMTAWVFGGMGSWNDLGFAERADHDRYEQLSAELHSAVSDGIAAGVSR